MLKKLYLICITALLLMGCESVTVETDYDKYVELSNEGHALMTQNKFEEALELFKEADTYSDGDDTALNNISWALNELTEFEESYEFIIKALEIKPNTSAEYNNAGNALVGLMRYEEAVEVYLKAIKEDDNEFLSYYNLGTAYMHLEIFDKALEALETALTYESDYDAEISKLECLIYLDETLKAYSYVDQLMLLYPEDYDVHDYKATIIQYVDTDENIVEYLTEFIDQFPEEPEAKMSLGIYYYESNQLKNAIDYFETLTPTEDALVYLWLAYAYSNYGLYDEAIETANVLIALEPENYDGKNALGQIYLDQSQYLKALPYFLDAAELTQDSTPAINVMYALFEAQRYQRCIDYGLKVLEYYEDDLDILWYIGNAYYNKNDYVKAIVYYNKMLMISPEDEVMLYYIADAYYLLNDYKMASKKINEYLLLYPEDDDALYLVEMINETSKPTNEIISSLFDEYYLYDVKDIQWPSDVNDLNDVNLEVVYDSIKQKDDIFTYMVYGEDYALEVEPLETIELYELSDVTYYMYIPFFDENTDHLFVEAIDKIPNPKDKNLIIDLSSNGGGLTESANNILNAMLGECITSQIIFKDGYTYSYESDAFLTEFEHLYIVVDEYSASAAELMTLGLKTYLPNVTIIGEQTYGKGVGQYVYDDVRKNRLYFVVNHFWNVREFNVSDEGITPDVYVSADDVYDYLTEQFVEE